MRCFLGSFGSSSPAVRRTAAEGCSVAERPPSSRPPLEARRVHTGLRHIPDRTDASTRTLTANPGPLTPAVPTTIARARVLLLNVLRLPTISQ